MKEILETFHKLCDLWDYELGIREQAIQQVRELHKQIRPFNNPNIDICNSCKTNYPCPTIKALDGEQ